MPVIYKLAADLVVVVHVGYVSFVILGELLVILGMVCGWEWIRNFWFRWLHLGAIAIVVAESLAGLVCPLTTLEAWLRREAGQSTYRGDFIGHWAHELLFYDAPTWVFTLAYSLFGLLVAGTLWLAPPRRRPERGICPPDCKV